MDGFFQITLDCRRFYSATIRSNSFGLNKEGLDWSNIFEYTTHNDFNIVGLLIELVITTYFEFRKKTNLYTFEKY